MCPLHTLARAHTLQMALMPIGCRSVVYIDEAEKAWLTDKKKLKEQGGQEPYSRCAELH